MKYILKSIIFGFFIFLLAVLPAESAGFSDLLNQAKGVVGGGGGLSTAEIVQGLKEALQIGTKNAVNFVSATNGYYQNPEIKIPLPGQVEKADKYLRMAGYGDTVDEFELSMNRAAERAAPEATAIFEDAVRKMTFDDAKKILNGRDNEATVYFKEKTYDRLQESFKPIVAQSMGEVGATRYYQDINSKLSSIPFADQMNFDLDQYVTAKSLDGLFFMLAAEEKKIRENPTARVTDLLQKVFDTPK